MRDLVENFTESFDPQVLGWWVGMCLISILNVGIWFSLWKSEGGSRLERRQLVLSGIYVLVCASRSVTPRADIQRFGLWDSWISAIVVGRSLATLGEMCFAAQWTLYLHELSRRLASEALRRISKLILPLIAVAEICSWYAVLTLRSWANFAENGLWTAVSVLMAAGVLSVLPKTAGMLSAFLWGWVAFTACFVTFMVSVDLPMYAHRMIEDAAGHRVFLSIREGLFDVCHRWVVTRSFSDWKEEMAWLFLYFSVAVWSSLALVRAPLPKEAT